MGKPVPSAEIKGTHDFSVATFTTNWNRLSPEAKTALFGRSDLRQELDSLANIIGDFKAAERMANISRSGTAGAFLSTVIGVGAGLATDPVTGVKAAAGAAGLPYALSKLMTSEKFVNWLGKGAHIAATKPNDLRVHVARLANLKLADRYEPFLNDVYQYLQGGASNE
jgi:hypothetical protein